ncbi:MAG: hypothetical protein JW918_04890 [Anaerolineae bacterium]|nr:hypothetical protein [Anaerolineae bacterium]
MKSPASRVDIAGWWYELDQRVKIGAAVGLGLIVIILCIAAILIASKLFPTSSPLEPTSDAESPVSVMPTAPPPTWTPAPTEVPPTEEPTPEPTVPAFAVDAQGDAVVYETGNPVEEIPAGIDIRVASIGAGMAVALESPEEVPEALAGWASGDEVLLWVQLYESIPEEPAEKLEWFFALDMDGDTATGRPAGQRPINPDMGYEVAIALAYDPGTDAYSTYCLVWAAGSWVAGPEVRYTIDESGALIGLAISREGLVQSVADNSGVTTVPDGVRGRVAAFSAAGAERVADFYPELPE